MERELSRKLHKDYITVRRIRLCILSVVMTGVAVGYLWLAAVKDWTMIPGWSVIGLLVLNFVFEWWIVPKWRIEQYRYELFDEELEIKSGLIFITNLLVPMVRVQHVELETGPLLRKYDLAKVSVVTAAGTHEISGLKMEEARQLKRRIGILAKVDENDEE